jgi:hypothetical protein
MMTEAQQIQMCGETFQQLKDGYENSLGYGAPSQMIYIMGFLSDAQAMIEHGDKEGARQILNGAKFLMSEYHMGDHE